MRVLVVDRAFDLVYVAPVVLVAVLQPEDRSRVRRLLIPLHVDNLDLLGVRAGLDLDRLLLGVVVAGRPAVHGSADAFVGVDLGALFYRLPKLRDRRIPSVQRRQPDPTLCRDLLISRPEPRRRRSDRHQAVLINRRPARFLRRLRRCLCHTAYVPRLCEIRNGTCVVPYANRRLGFTVLKSNPLRYPSPILSNFLASPY